MKLVIDTDQLDEAGIAIEYDVGRMVVRLLRQIARDCAAEAVRIEKQFPDQADRERRRSVECRDVARRLDRLLRGFMLPTGHAFFREWEPPA